MALGFHKDALALNFAPHAHTGYGSREFILWPAWAYRVVAPRVRKRTLNLFQRAVLGLCWTHVNGAKEIAQKLGIDPQLAALILEELRSLGYLDGRYAPAPAGLQVLQEDSFDSDDMVAGYVFQDPWSGDLWPRFCERLFYSDLQINDHGHLALVFDRKGRRKRYRAFMIPHPEPASPVCPTAQAVVGAIAAHRRALRFSDRSSVWAEDDAEDTFTATGTRIERVSFIQERPTPVYLTSFVYIPKDSNEGVGWYVCDPFGLGASPKFHKRIEQALPNTPSLLAVINRLFGQGLLEGLDDHKVWMQQLWEKASMEVERHLAANIRAHAAYRYIVEMEFAHQEIQYLEIARRSSKLGDALRACVKVLEAVFGSLATAHPPGEVWKRVYAYQIDQRTGKRYLGPQGDLELLEALYDSAAAAAGFAVPIPASFRSIRPGHIRSVAQHHANWRLRPLVSTTLLAAQADAAHPLRLAAKRAPQLLEAIEQIAALGSPGGHANEDDIVMSQVSDTVNLAYAVVAVLTGFNVRDEQMEALNTGATHGQEL